MDQSDEAAVALATASTLREFGQIDVLVVSAGITGPNAPLADYPTEAWRKVMDVNVNGTFYVNRAVVPHMVARKYGRIVNLASVAGKDGNPNAAAYSASKAAVICLTKSLGKELARSGISVNVVTPAAVRTAIFDQMSKAHIDFMLSKIPAGRFGTVEENAALIAWLASAECSFSTGAVFDISGGRSTY
jgi:3-oxoacyl-[acyl-carrier protein] reductase